MFYLLFRPSICPFVCAQSIYLHNCFNRNNFLYSTSTRKVENISVRTIYRWKRRFIRFLMT